MLKIRLKRTGCKKKSFYKIVVAPSLAKRDGKTIEDIGYYDPIKKKFSIQKTIFLKYFINGAQPTKIIKNLILKNWSKII